MPRRQQHRKKNKRHRKGSYDRDSREESYNATMATTSLEEDLRQQRIRQQERQKLRELEEEKKRAENEAADDDEDCNHDVGFLPPSKFYENHSISNAVARTNHLVLKGAVSPESTVSRSKSGENGDENLSALPSSTIRLPPSFLLRHIEQTSPMLPVHKRNTLRKLWPTQHHLETMSVTPRAASLYDKTKWPQYETSYPAGERCSWDLSCKIRLHPSARTLDVTMLGSDPTPTIATIFHDGWGLLRHKLHHKIVTIDAPPVYSVRMHERSSMCGIIFRRASLQRDNHRPNSQPRMCSTYSFRWYPLPHTTSHVEVEMPRFVTDFCFGNDIALFSSQRFGYSGSLNPLLLPLVDASNGNNAYLNSPVRSINVRNFPQSDAMRVEMMCEQQEKLVAFGHRNGQVSVLDLRASGTVCSILQYEASAAAVAGRGGPPSGSHLGTVSDLGFLSAGKHGNSASGGHQVLVKRSFGSCQLHDLRKASSSIGSSSSSSNHTSTTVVHNLCVPPSEIHPLTRNCNGFAVDPNGQQTMVSPYISSPSGDARLGIWSLETGHMVGSRLLMANHYGDREDTILHVEMCSRTVPSLQPNNGTKTDDSSFGVWLKCGAITKGKLRSKVGSLHQIAIPGRWECDTEKHQNGES